MVYELIDILYIIIAEQQKLLLETIRTGLQRRLTTLV